MKDHDFMARAIELAARGRLKVQPNPMVGCVIVRNNKIIGEGWHKEYGKDHAEMDAIKNCKRKFGAKRENSGRRCRGYRRNSTKPSIEPIESWRS